MSNHFDLGRVFVCLDDREFLRGSGHYLIYGSEFHLALAARLGRDHQDVYRRARCKIGTPTVLVCHVPWSAIDQPSVREIAQELVWQLRGARYRQPRTAPCLDHTVVLRTDLLPEWIIRHHHPNRVPDPHDGMVEHCWESVA